MAGGSTEIIPRRSLEIRAADAIRGRIVNGELPLGTRLVETDLAERHGLSRGTIRAALRRLVDEDLVCQVPYSGYRVVELSERDLWELYTLRESLDRLAARLAAECIDDTGAARLREAFQALVRGAEHEAHAEADRRDYELHQLIIQLSGHQRLATLYARIENQFRAYISLSNRGVTSTEIAESHRYLVESICRGDTDRAERAATANINYPDAATFSD